MGLRCWCSLFLLGIRLVAYGHLASLSLLSPTLSTTNSPIISLVRRLSIQRSPCDLWSHWCLKGLPERGASQDARSEERAADGAMPIRAGHSHNPNERGQSVPRHLVPRPPRPPHALLLDSPGHLPPPPSMAPPSPDWLVCNARSRLLNISLFRPPECAGSPQGVAMAAATVRAAVVV